MRIIETTAHIGSRRHAVRLEVPLEQRNQDVRVAVVVDTSPSTLTSETSPPTEEDQWSTRFGRKLTLPESTFHRPEAGTPVRQSRFSSMAPLFLKPWWKTDDECLPT